MRSSALLGILFFITCYLTVGQALDCYTCFPDESKNCSDPNVGEIKTCQEGEELCLKIVLDKRVTRSCYLDIPKRKQESCREKGPVAECYCSGDLCNGSFQVQGEVIGSMCLSFILLIKQLY
ncbi:uncharacterized protein [Lepeophtheirus salmonis]|uniref:uncharacterized protein n=1 Tax=Lepeophtheirus salmonis TaxID=72036 RepID=UPI00077F0747|nr:uncharacterized protein LOC121116767 [Lepeophtheirus salmonis]